MKIIWTFTLLMIPGVLSSISVTGYSGGGVNISCKYNKQYTDNAKYFCRGKKPERVKAVWCSDLIRTKGKEKHVDSGRLSLFDDTTAAVFNVTFRDLREGDSGTYQCAIQIHSKPNSYSEVKLNVRVARNKHPTSSSFSSAEAPLISSASPETGSSLIISVSVFLLLLIFTVIVFVIVCLWRRHHVSHSSSKRSHTTPAYREEVSRNTVIPKRCSSDKVQEHTGDSQILITSSEDLNYAVVNFQKKVERPDSVRLRNNQDYSEYAAVNHHLT